MRQALWGVAITAWASLATAAAVAQQSQDWQGCANPGEATSLDQQVAGCTALIQSAQTTQRDLAIAYRNRGSAWRDKGNPDRAIADYDAAIRLDANNALPYNGRGNAWYDKGDLDRAIADYDVAIRFDPTGAAAHNGRGIAWHDKGDPGRAIADLDEAIRLDPTFA